MWKCHSTHNGVKFKGTSHAKQFETNAQIAHRQYNLLCAALESVRAEFKRPEVLAVLPNVDHGAVYDLEEKLLGLFFSFIFCPEIAKNPTFVSYRLVAYLDELQAAATQRDLPQASKSLLMAVAPRPRRTSKH